MLDESLVKLLAAVAPALVALAGVFVARAGFMLARSQRDDQWVRAFAELHKEFWNEHPYGIVRGWLACDTNYEQLRSILEKRRHRSSDLTPDEYMSLEKLDKFLNLLSRAAHVTPSFPAEKNLWNDLFFHYWFAECRKPSRSELQWYLDRFYQGLQHRVAAFSADGRTTSLSTGA